MSNKPKVLIVDDEESIRKLLQSRLERDGFSVVLASSGPEAQKAMESQGPFGVLVTDLKMPGMDGFALLQWAKDKTPGLRVIVITGHGEKEAAVQSLRVGAADYLEKPFDLDEISHSVRRAESEWRMERENKDLLGRLEARVERIEGKQEDRFWFVSKAKSMEKVNDWLSVLRRESMRGGADEPSVVVLGESGTGKEGIARMIHAGSRRAKGPWVAVNCANFSEQLLESELFGHEKGAFTGAQTLKRGLLEIAKGGSLLLDEVGEMDIKLQAKLLRVLQERVFRRVGGTADLECDVRIIAATNRDLQSRVTGGAFREDLYHRLTRVTIEVPALRERIEDTIPMARQFCERAFTSRSKTFEGFTPDAEAALAAYSWPGNVRELLNVVERVALLWTGSGPVSLKMLSLPASPVSLMSRRPAQTDSNGVSMGPHLAEVPSPFQSPESHGVQGYMELKKKWSDSFEREYIVAALARHGGNVSAAAREAKLDRSNFLRLLRRHGLKAMEYRKAA